MLALLAVVACVDPAAFGAVPDDGKSDTAAIQQAIDAAIPKGADVCLGPGVFTLDRTRKIGSLMVAGGPLVIRGAGATLTHLRMSGSGHRGDWRAIEIVDAHDIVIRDLGIDGLEAIETEEQTHLIELGPDTHDVIIARVELGPMRRPDQKVGQGIGGDCIRAVGREKFPVERVLIADVRMVDCDRSGLMVQRAVRELVFTRSEIIGTGDTPIDFEPTAPGVMEDFTFTDLQIHRPALGQGQYAITIVGYGKHVLLARSVLDGGGILIANMDAVTIEDNEITNGPGVEPTISVFRNVNDVTFRRNHVTRAATAKPGALLRSAHNNKGIPHGFLIEDNVLFQGTTAPVLSLESADGIVLRHNDITYAGAQGRAILDVQAIVADIVDVEVSGNTIRGPASQVVRLAPRTHEVEVDIFDNVVEGTRIGVTCDGEPSHFRGVHLGEDYLGHQCGEVKTFAWEKRTRNLVKRK